MNKINRIILCILISFVSCTKDNDVDDEVVTPYEVVVNGKLSDYVNDDNIYKITKLTLLDTICGEDWNILREMTYAGKMETLVMTEVKIVGVDSLDFWNEDEIPSFSFSSCRNLKSVALPNRLQTIGEEAFSKCRNLSAVSFPDRIDSIGPRAFYETGMSGVFSVPSVRIIAKQAFARTQIVKVVISNDIEAAKSNTMYTIGGNSVFAYCDKLKEVVVTEGCTALELGFQGCTSLTTISLPTTLRSIGHKSGNTHNYIFCRCSSLKNISLPINLCFIGYNAFSYTAISNIIIPDNVQYLWTYAFSSCQSLQSISLANNLKKISQGCFEDCTSLQNIIIPNQVTQIDYRAFAGCASLNTITFGNDLEEIGRYAFYGCTSLLSVLLPSTVTSIGESAFEGCRNLSNVTLSDNLEEIESLTFKDCINLHDIHIGTSVSSIGSSAFFHCPLLTNVQIPSTVIAIGEYAYAYTGLQNVTVFWDFPLVVPENIFVGTNIMSATLKVPVGTTSTYQIAPVWGGFGQIIDQ